MGADEASIYLKAASISRMHIASSVGGSIFYLLQLRWKIRGQEGVRKWSGRGQKGVRKGSGRGQEGVRK